MCHLLMIKILFYLIHHHLETVFDVVTADFHGKTKTFVEKSQGILSEFVTQTS